ncbi:Adenosyl-chloride synthase [Aquicella siphonis]|uniref:Adenosyl-chloride synthase n=1 Tax=Aquicella siphonis TaxID=254247 RepID=A0A5E4PHX5_9COXI|nr:S-adenosyl-l-methionine hydroxide adenosyltransferase family protein [Aquicella siphonis]VVC76057.1 Adenosyl-chloride synthase [Aquicella siphonis]
MKSFVVRTGWWIAVWYLCALSAVYAASGIVVFQSDFGVKDGAVSEVKGVMYSVNQSLLVSDLTHEIPPFNIWDAGYRLFQTAPYWPKGTVFVSVVDPGVGTARRSIVAKTRTGQYFVTPDNGTLTLIDDAIGIEEVRLIDESVNRLKKSGASYTFHGRDVYAYTAAKLASGVISFAGVGPVLKTPIVKLVYQKPVISDHKLTGAIVILDPQYGNLWTNISQDMLNRFGLEKGKKYKIKIFQNQQVRYEAVLPYVTTFGAVPKGAGLIYVNSLLNLAIAINQGNFAATHGIGSGAGWKIVISPV